MKMSNYTMVNVLNTLNSFGNKKLPQKISYAITRNIMIFRKEYEFYEREFGKLLVKYDKDIENDVDGNMVHNKDGVPVVNGEASKDFYNELNELLMIELDISIYQISPEVFDYEDSERYDAMSASEIIQLQSIICDMANEESE